MGLNRLPDWKRGTVRRALAAPMPDDPDSSEEPGYISPCGKWGVCRVGEHPLTGDRRFKGWLAIHLRTGMAITYCKHVNMLSCMRRVLLISARASLWDFGTFGEHGLTARQLAVRRNHVRKVLVDAL